MIIVNHIYGHCDDLFWSGICEELDERGGLELLPLCHERLNGGQMRAMTDKGTVVGVLLERGADLRPGSVLFYEEGRRVVLAELRDARILVIATLNDFTQQDALELGHYLGERGWHLHVRPQPTHLEIFVRYESHSAPTTNKATDALGQEEEAMDAVLRASPVQNISWTFRDRLATDPL